jgi:hypothetical protein
MQGPNVKRLIASKMSLLMVPPGSGDGKGKAFQVAMEALTKPGNVAKVAREATAWVEAALHAVREAAEPNPWKSADDEAIAAEILKGIEARSEATRVPP